MNAKQTKHTATTAPHSTELYRRPALLTASLMMLISPLAACGGGGSDGGSASTPVTTTNATPVANAGIDQTVVTGNVVSLSGGNSSDSDGDSLSFTWTLTSSPTGSNVSLSSSSIAGPTFTPGVDGDYTFSLTVNDGTATSVADSVSIFAATVIVSGTADFHTPAPIVDILASERTLNWEEMTVIPTNLTRFSFGEAGSNDIFVLTDAGGSVGSGLAVATTLSTETSIADDTLLRTMFKFIELDDGSFRIVSTKHSNYVLDVADPGITDALVLRDYRSGGRDTSNTAYLAFTVTGTSPMTLSATGRKVLNSATFEYEDDATWVTKEILLVNGELLLTTGSGTSLTLYNPPINFDIPFDFNPDGIERVSNEEVTPVFGTDDPLADVATRVVSAYADQVAARGIDAGTTAAAELVLADIETTLVAEGAQMRYTAEFYMALRNGFLSRVYQSSDSTDGVIGQLTVPYVYFTNGADADGVHHPFMIIATYGLPDTLTLLWDVARPPGDGIAQEYTDQAVTRSMHRDRFLLKIPMRDYGEVENLTENTMIADLASDVNETTLSHHNYASISATGVALDGVVIYPTFNNSLHVSQTAAELSAHGMHSGRGLGPHYHADAHSATGEGLNLYNAADYDGHSHPPIVSIGFDGVAGYGVYMEGDTSSDGVNVTLDEFGGHEHDGYAYHYHSFTEQEVTAAGAGPGDPAGGIEYTAHKLPPLGAWAGRINGIPEFWGQRAPEIVGGDNSVYLGTL